MIDKSKTYKTRDGREVRIYATDGFSSAAIHGAYKDEHNRWIQHSWDAQGRCYEREMDLIEVRPRHKRTVWLNVYEHDEYYVYGIKKEADCAATDSRLACIKVELDFEEGEGL